MSKLKEVIAYILLNYPHQNELSNARLTKMVYLADWKHAIQNQRQITDINWYFDNYGPFVPDIKMAVDKNKSLFLCNNTKNVYGSPKTKFSIRDKSYRPNIDKSEVEAIQHIITQTKSLNWSEFINLVYSTYPISTSNRYSHLDLVEKAKEYVNSEQV